VPGDAANTGSGGVTAGRAICADFWAHSLDLEEFIVSTVTAMPSRMSAGEWQTRCDLAASYRLIDLLGWSDLLGTHISARVPGPEDYFLLRA